MYVCICNSLNQRRVSRALDDGADTVSQIYRSCGCSAQCGKCAAMMREMMRSRQAPHGSDSEFAGT